MRAACLKNSVELLSPPVFKENNNENIYLFNVEYNTNSYNIANKFQRNPRQIPRQNRRQHVWPRRFYLTGDMTSLYQFIQGLLEWPFSELFSANNVSLWNQYKYIVFNIFTSRILIISYKMLIITGISNEKTYALTIYGILCQNVTIFYRQALGSLFQLQEKLKACRNSKLNFLSSCFIADDSHVKTVWLNVVVFSEHDILHFWGSVHLSKYYPLKVTQNCFDSFNCSNQTCIQLSKYFVFTQ